MEIEDKAENLMKKLAKLEEINLDINDIYDEGIDLRAKRFEDLYKFYSLIPAAYMDLVKEIPITNYLHNLAKKMINGLLEKENKGYREKLKFLVRVKKETASILEEIEGINAMNDYLKNPKLDEIFKAYQPKLHETLNSASKAKEVYVQILKRKAKD
jgi:hypothetical protein